MSDRGQIHYRGARENKRSRAIFREMERVSERRDSLHDRGRLLTSCRSDNHERGSLNEAPGRRRRRDEERSHTSGSHHWRNDDAEDGVKRKRLEKEKISLEYNNAEEASFCNDHRESMLKEESHHSRQLKSKKLIDRMSENGLLKSFNSATRNENSEHSSPSLSLLYGVVLCGVDFSVSTFHIQSIVEHLCSVKPDRVCRPALDFLRTTISTSAKGISPSEALVNPTDPPSAYDVNPYLRVGGAEGPSVVGLPKDIHIPPEQLKNISLVADSMNANGTGEIVLLEFKDECVASQSIHLLNGAEINGRKIFASPLLFPV